MEQARSGDKFLYSSTWEVEDQEFKVSFSFIVSLRPAWETVTDKQTKKPHNILKKDS